MKSYTATDIDQAMFDLCQRFPERVNPLLNPAYEDGELIGSGGCAYNSADKTEHCIAGTFFVEQSDDPDRVIADMDVAEGSTATQLARALGVEVHHSRLNMWQQVADGHNVLSWGLAVNENERGAQLPRPWGEVAQIMKEHS